MSFCPTSAPLLHHFCTTSRDQWVECPIPPPALPPSRTTDSLTALGESVLASSHANPPTAHALMCKRLSLHQVGKVGTAYDELLVKAKSALEEATAEGQPPLRLTTRTDGTPNLHVDSGGVRYDFQVSPIVTRSLAHSTHTRFPVHLSVPHGYLPLCSSSPSNNSDNGWGAAVAARRISFDFPLLRPSLALIQCIARASAWICARN